MKKQGSASGIAAKSQLAKVKEVEHDADSDIGEELVQPKNKCLLLRTLVLMLQYRHLSWY